VPFRANRLRPQLWMRAQFCDPRGKIDLKRRPLSRFTVNQDVSPTLLDNAINRGQSQAGSLPISLGGEEGFKNADKVASSMPSRCRLPRAVYIFLRKGLTADRRRPRRLSPAQLQNKLAAPEACVARVTARLTTTWSSWPGSASITAEDAFDTIRTSMSSPAAAQQLGNILQFDRSCRAVAAELPTCG